MLMKGTLEQLPQLYEAKFAQSQKNPTRVPLGKYFRYSARWQMNPNQSHPFNICRYIRVLHVLFCLFYNNPQRSNEGWMSPLTFFASLTPFMKERERRNISSYGDVILFHL